MEKTIAFEEPQKKAVPGKVAADAPVDYRGIQLVWPTQYRVITLPFGVNPELFAARGLPGHEGLDLRAPHESPVYAAANGTVAAINERVTSEDPYGRWMRIEHADGYISLYAHLSRLAVSKGAKVTAGQMVGHAGATGETAGGHIHFGLMRTGASAEQLTHYPDDIIDPTPFLFAASPQTAASTYPWPLGRCLPGASLEANGNPAYLGATKPEAVKLWLDTNREQIGRIRKLIPDAFLLTTITVPMRQRVLTPRDWVAQVRATLKGHIDAGIAYFEVQSSPNLSASGPFSAWASGQEFARWWIETTNLLRELAPHAKFGFPGLANGPQAAGQRMASHVFMEGADDALLAADWIGVQAYWNNSAEATDEALGAHHLLMRRWYPHKLLFITEFANTNPLTNDDFKQQEYATFFSGLQANPGIGAAFLTAVPSLI